MTHCHHLVALFSVPLRPECDVENTKGRVLTEMNDPIILLSGFKASVSVWRTGHMTTRWLTHTDRMGWVGVGRGSGRGARNVWTLRWATASVSTRHQHSMTGRHKQPHPEHMATPRSHDWCVRATVLLCPKSRGCIFFANYVAFGATSLDSMALSILNLNPSWPNISQNASQPDLWALFGTGTVNDAAGLLVLQRLPPLNWDRCSTHVQACKDWTGLASLCDHVSGVAAAPQGWAARRPYQAEVCCRLSRCVLEDTWKPRDSWTLGV